MTLILFIIILAVLIFVHELGHFLVAKKSGIRVDEFAIGFPPKIWSWRKNETDYIINLIPFGGYVKIFGESPDEESINGKDKERSLVNKSKPIQILVLASGIIFNILFAWILLSVGFMSGLPTAIDDNQYPDLVKNPHIVITSVLPSSPAEKVGILPGDSIVDLKDGTNDISSLTVEKVQQAIAENKSGKISLTYERDNKNTTVEITPADGLVNNKKAIGIGMSFVGTLQLPLHLAFWEGGKSAYYMTLNTAIGLGQFIYQTFTGKADFSQVAGPIGIVKLVGSAQGLGFAYVLSFIAFISINLAVINLIPFPALDGGRILFVIIEAIKRSPIKPKVANITNAIGFGVLIILMLVITYHDILKLVLK